jgi:hypothetical protein
MNVNEKKNELNTEKKRNGKIITENENIDEVHSLKRFPLKKLETETTSNNLFDSAKKETKKIDVKSQTLVIEVISSTLPLGEILRVGPTGLEHGRRKARDGVAFFGFEEESDENVKYFFNASPKWITSFRRRKTSSTGGSTESTSKSASTATT